MIKIISIDRTIWNIDRVVIDIVLAIIDKPAKLFLSFNGEGPCLTHLGFYNLLDDICAKFNYPKNSVYIETANFLEAHNEYNIVKVHQEYELTATKKKSTPSLVIEKVFNSEFKHFGHFIGHSNQYRLQLASYLYANQQTKTLQSYHCQVTDDYHKEHIGLEDLLTSGCSQEEFEWAKNLINVAPLTVDMPGATEIIGVPANLGIIEYYKNFFVELVSLSFYSGNTFYIDEKVWRPMLMKTPFMIQGPQGVIKNLHKLGFKTFNQWWDEAYADYPSNCHISVMIDNIQRLSVLSISDLEKMYNEMSDILEHNHNRLLELTNDDFTKAFDE